MFKKFLLMILFAVGIIFLGGQNNFASADTYPGTLDSGNLVLVDGGMGVGIYAIRSSVSVDYYNPPIYEISINYVPVTFSEDYYRRNSTYSGGPYTIGNPNRLRFRYNWNSKIISYIRNGQWYDWDFRRDYSHAEGYPRIPYTAEVAFVSAYNMRFLNNKQYYSPSLKKYYRVIDEDLYSRLGI